MIMIFDSHFHLPSMIEKGLDPSLPPSFFGMEVATLPDDAEERIRLVGRREDVYLSMGAGPWCTSSSYQFTLDETIEKLREEISLYGADAIGECGFDFHWDYGSREEQSRLFIIQAEIARDLDIPLIIHSRDADDILLSHIDYINERTIMHCFSSSPQVMEKLLSRGAYISFAGNVTYKNNSDIQVCARVCPIDRLLYETDSPYLTPSPLRGKPNRTENTELTLSFLSRLRGEEEDYIKENAVKNFLSLMKDRESVVCRNLPVR